MFADSASSAKLLEHGRSGTAATIAVAVEEKGLCCISATVLGRIITNAGFGKLLGGRGLLITRRGPGKLGVNRESERM